MGIERLPLITLDCSSPNSLSGIVNWTRTNVWIEENNISRDSLVDIRKAKIEVVCYEELINGSAASYTGSLHKINGQVQSLRPGLNSGHSTDIRSVTATSPHMCTAAVWFSNDLRGFGVGGSTYIGPSYTSCGWASSTSVASTSRTPENFSASLPLTEAGTIVGTTLTIILAVVAIIVCSTIVSVYFVKTRRKNRRDEIKRLEGKYELDNGHYEFCGENIHYDQVTIYDTIEISIEDHSNIILKSDDSNIGYVSRQDSEVSTDISGLDLPVSGANLLEEVPPIFSGYTAIGVFTAGQPCQ